MWKRFGRSSDSCKLMKLNQRKWKKHGQALLALTLILSAKASAGAETSYEIPPVLTGPGAVFMAVGEEPLELEVSLLPLGMQDRYEGNLYFYLLGPDRQLLANGHLLERDASKEEPARAKLPVIQLEEPGICKLLIVSTGWNGSFYDVAWGFSTNAPKYVLARGEWPGHRGRTPFRIVGGERTPPIYFRPPQGTFAFEVSSASEGALEILSPTGEKAVTASVLPEESYRTRLESEGHDLWSIANWRGDLTLNIDGVTRWGAWGGFEYENHGFFTFHPTAWFPIDELRWLVDPAFQVIAATPEEGDGEVRFTLYNHSDRTEYEVELELEAPSGASPTLVDESQTIRLKPGQETEVAFPYQLEEPLAEPVESRLRYSTDGLRSYATVRFVPPVAYVKPELPIVYRPFQHVVEQYDYAPRIPLNDWNFDQENRPWVRQRISRDRSDGLYLFRDGQWELHSFVEAIKKVLPDFERTVLGTVFLPTRTAFDEMGGIYTIVSATETGQTADAVRVLLYKADPDAPFQAVILDEPGRALADLEGFSGFNQSKEPPPIVHYRILETPRDLPEAESWRVRTRIELILPEILEDGSLSVENRIPITEDGINLCTHSGGASTIASIGDKVHVAYGEVVDSDQAAQTPGVPTYVVTYDRSKQALGDPVLVGYAPPVNDMHNSPGLTVDSSGRLHVVMGAHARNPFHYTRSREPNDIHGGWTVPQPVLHTGMKAGGVGPSESGAQTYVGLVSAPDDTLHVAFRHDLQDVEGPFPGYTERYRALSVQRKKPGEPWEEPTILIIPPLPGYSIYYHRLTIDREGDLYLYFSYRPGDSLYRSTVKGTDNHTGLFRSRDNGESWELLMEIE